jgi:L-ascorbate metabolism protein UlaG (beta-lactamase superfamily)
MPSVKTNLKELNNGLPHLIWFGHSSYLLRINGINILVDPVFSGYASPYSFLGGCFPGSNVYGVEDMPDIDILLLTHDHYDHLDFDTVMKLQHKTKAIITSLGVGSHLQYWGIAANKITELDWWQSKEIFTGFRFTAAPARHFSGRGFTRAKTLWSSFILQAGEYKIYLGGDSGYDTHFSEIGRQYGPFDLAILENGQYDLRWKYIHVT